MSLLRTLGYLPTACLRPLAETDAEIREELQFHLEMRTLDNLAAGMTNEEAIQDARNRFGDFEHNYRACRRASLGFRLALQRIQTALLVLLLGTVALLSVKMLQARADYQSNLQALTARLEFLDQHRARLAAANSNRIPYTAWDHVLIDDQGNVPSRRDAERHVWLAPGPPLDEPWCDWRSLDEPSAP